jgi:hypothetical protein
VHVVKPVSKMTWKEIHALIARGRRFFIRAGKEARDRGEYGSDQPKYHEGKRPR